VSISFIHTADWQIGRVFGNVGADAGVLLRRQRIRTVQRIAELATERQVDAVLVAGDVFETNTVSNETIHGLLQAMEPYEGSWVLLPGNHDPALVESVWSRIECLGRPANVYIAVTSDPILLGEGRLAVLPAPLLRKHESEDLTSAWDNTVTLPGAIRVGLGHGSVKSHLPGSGEAPNPIAEDRGSRARLDYLALGDWHGTVQIDPRTWYSGTPEPDRFKANDSGNLLLVSIEEADKLPKVRPVRVAYYTWDDLQFSLNSADDIAVLEAKLTELGAPFDRHVVSLTLAGALDLNARQQLELCLSRWRARFPSLQEELSAMFAQPTDDDLDRIDTGGFIRAGVNRLRAIHHDPGHPNQPYGAGALQLLYQIHATVDQNQ
jgi:DNA repair exonuclease SbcCD nuclease subunit